MIETSDEDFFKSTLKIGSIYYFKYEKLKDTKDSHPFIVIHKKNSDYIILGNTTTQIEKRIKALEINKFPESTLVFIKPDEKNKLKKESVVDCNTNIWVEDESNLKSIRQKKGMRIYGTVSKNIIEQLRQGIKDSPMITQEIKDIVNS
ncbi:hypothetical protein ES708_21691 [subsurface metagenome]